MERDNLPAYLWGSGSTAGRLHMFTRKEHALRALRYYRGCKSEYRKQRLDAWLSLATPGEVRRNWRDWMGAMPIWAEKKRNG